MLGFAPKHFIAMLALRVLDQNFPQGPLNKYDESNHCHSHNEYSNNQKRRQRTCPAQLQRANKRARNFSNNAAENNQRNTVTDTAGCNLLTKPHQE